VESHEIAKLVARPSSHSATITGKVAGNGQGREFSLATSHPDLASNANRQESHEMIGD
jgi:hypothetical protein